MDLIMEEEFIGLFTYLHFDIYIFYLKISMFLFTGYLKFCTDLTESGE